MLAHSAEHMDNDTFYEAPEYPEHSAYAANEAADYYGDHKYYKAPEAADWAS